MSTTHPDHDEGPSSQLTPPVAPSVKGKRTHLDLPCLGGIQMTAIGIFACDPNDKAAEAFIREHEAVTKRTKFLQAEAERMLAETARLEQQASETKQQRLEIEESNRRTHEQIARYAAKLRELGIDPDTLK